jgi:hypothetical protein
VTVRVLVPSPAASPFSKALTKQLLQQHIDRALADPEVTSFVVHKPGSRFTGADGRERVVGLDGEPRLVDVAAAEGVTSC